MAAQTLWGDSVRVLAQTITDSAGQFLFENVEADDFQIEIHWLKNEILQAVYFKSGLDFNEKSVMDLGNFDLTEPVIFQGVFRYELEENQLNLGNHFKISLLGTTF